MTNRDGRVLGFLLVLTVSCATTQYDGYGPITDEPEISKTLEEVARLEQGETSLESQIPNANLPAPDLEKRILARLEELESSHGVVLGRLAELSEQVKVLQTQLVKKESISDTLLVNKAPQQQRKTEDVNSLYEKALQAFDKQQYSEASGFLGKIMAVNSRGSLADNAQYWLGECAYAVKDYTGALEAFKRVFQFADTEKDDDAQLKLGYCYLRLGDSESALIEYKRLTVDYPDSEYLQRAEEQIRRIRAARVSKP